MSDVATPPTPISAADISDLSFEQALEQLERIVSELESGQAPLERSIDIYARGASLKAHCEAKLQAARLRVEKIVVGPSGEALRADPAEFP
jgi:exodeoxyribonuclease VII small subunit